MVKLPDFDEIARQIDEISELALMKANLDMDIKLEEANVVREAYNNTEYFINGKPPAMNYIEATYLRTGLDGTLMQKRRKLATIASALEARRLKYDLVKAQIEVWRSEQANQRTGTL